ncbi:hypothetical protein PTKIN_Ptkin06aG0201700 [Pterospermum kingtungense]
MARIALVLVLSLALLLSIQCVAADEAFSPAPSAKGPSSSSAGTATNGDEVSWIGWAEDQLRGYGLLSPKKKLSEVSEPKSATFHVRPLGQGPAPAPAPMNYY